MNEARTMVACLECDLLQEETDVGPRGEAECARCGAQLFRDIPNSLDRALACFIGAAIFLVIANAFPALSLEAQGLRNTATILGSAQALYDDNERLVAILVFMTTILLPAIEIGAMVFLLGSLRVGYVPRSLSFVYRLAEAVRPWTMMSVFMIGVLVSLVKLSHMATVSLGIGVYALACAIVMIAAAASLYDPRAFWKRVGELRT
ncbi:MAG TPA: paraquat-inducible protein A [Usitatibacter sp.]